MNANNWIKILHLKTANAEPKSFGKSKIVYLFAMILNESLDFKSLVIINLKSGKTFFLSPLTIYLSAEFFIFSLSLLFLADATLIDISAMAIAAIAAIAARAFDQTKVVAALAEQPTGIASLHQRRLR